MYPVGDRNTEPVEFFLVFCDRRKCCEFFGRSRSCHLVPLVVCFFDLRLLFSCWSCPLLGAEGCVGLALFLLFFLFSCCFSSVPLFLGAASPPAFLFPCILPPLQDYCFPFEHPATRKARASLFEEAQNFYSIEPGRKGESPANRPVKRTCLTAQRICWIPFVITSFLLLLVQFLTCKYWCEYMRITVSLVHQCVCVSPMYMLCNIYIYIYVDVFFTFLNWILLAYHEGMSYQMFWFVWVLGWPDRGAIQDAFPRTHKGVDAKDSNSASVEWPKDPGKEVPVRDWLW